MTITESQLRKWCRPEPLARFPGLAAPWTVGNVTYAASSVVLIGGPKSMLGTFEAVGEVPKSAPALLEHDGPWEPLSLPQPTLDMPCRNCRATGRVTCNYGHRHNCEACSGKRSTPCAKEFVYFGMRAYDPQWIDLFREVFDPVAKSASMHCEGDRLIVRHDMVRAVVMGMAEYADE